MTLNQLLLILRARYRIIVFVLFLTVGLVTAVSLMLPKQYTANAAILVDAKAPDPMSGQVIQGLVSSSYISTQIDIINSDRVALAAAKSLSKGPSQALQQQWQGATQGKGQFTDWLAGSLRINLDVKPSRDSNVINLSYSAADPQFAASAANALAQAYIDVNLDLRLTPARQYATFFEEQTKAARDKLEKAQTALSDYQQQNGITSSEQQVDYETAKLNETSSLLTGIQGQTTDSQSKRQSAKADTVAEVMQSPVINGLKADIARLNAKLQESSINLGKNHPQTQRNEAELATLQNQLSSETLKITTSIDTTYQIGKQREQQLQAALAAQKARVLVLNKQRDELNVLRRDIESAQRAFETVSARASQTNVESQTNQTNVSVLNPAIQPTSPSKPRVLFNILVSVFLGGLLGTGLALVLELIHRRVRSPEDVVEALGLPILGSISSAANLLKQATANPGVGT